MTKEEIRLLNEARDILAKLHYENRSLCFNASLEEIDEMLDAQLKLKKN